VERGGGVASAGGTGLTTLDGAVLKPEDGIGAGGGGKAGDADGDVFIDGADEEPQEGWVVRRGIAEDGDVSALGQAGAQALHLRGKLTAAGLAAEKQT